MLCKPEQLQLLVWLPQSQIHDSDWQDEFRFLAPDEIVSVLVAQNGLATRDRKTTGMLSPLFPFQSKGFAHLLNVYFSARIENGRQRKTQSN
jgi:hypothetical protein